jgi:hypothetical protein
MPTIASLTSFTANTQAKAAEVNANFSAIRTTVNTYAAFVDLTATITGVWTFTVAPVLSGGLSVSSGGLTVSAGGITVTGNSTITGTLGGLTGLTMIGNGAITGTLSVSSTLTVAALAGAYTVPFSKLTAGENATTGTYGFGIANDTTSAFNCHAAVTIGQEQSNIMKVLRLGSRLVTTLSSGPSYEFSPWQYSNWDFTLTASHGSGLSCTTPSAAGAPMDSTGLTPVANGYRTSVRVIQDATGGRTWSLVGAVDFPNGTTQPTWATTANKEYIITMELRANRWRVMSYHE